MRKDKWLFRQFAYFRYVQGFNKLVTERITLNSGEMYGFRSGTLTGTSKMLLNLESVTYIPAKIIGFRFAPVLSAGFGMLGDEQKKLTNSTIYQAYSLGILIRNENLLNSTFNISVGLYPYLPDNPSVVIRMNPITSFSLRLRGFTTGKPNPIGYE